MRDLNSLVLIGRLTRDPELRSTNTGKDVCKFTVASTVKEDRQANTQVTLYQDVIVWEGTAKVCNEYLRKGSRVAIQGYLTPNEWTDQSGKKKSKNEMSVTSVQFLDPANKQGQQQAPPTTQGTPNYASHEQQPQHSADPRKDQQEADEQIPF